jgi:hypothetical protein
MKPAPVTNTLDRSTREYFEVLKLTLRTKVSSAIAPFLRRGSATWLIAKERQYGGWTGTIKRRKVSPYDPRSKEELAVGGMVGGDRMSEQHHGYAKHYAHFLAPFIGKPVVCAEVGILRGSGLAIWSDLFPQGKIIGLDIDPSHYRENLANLKSLGAFKAENVSVHEFDQYGCTVDTLSTILDGKRINIFIDDGTHTDEAIIRTLSSVRRHLSHDFLYVIEDNETVPLELLRASFGTNANIERHGELTIISNHLAARR